MGDTSGDYLSCDSRGPPLDNGSGAFGESFSAATKSAALIFVLLVLSILFVGVWVWV